MRDIISNFFFQRNKYRSKSQSIYDKDHLHQSENIGISHNSITFLFVIAYSGSKHVPKIYKNWKILHLVIVLSEKAKGK